MHDLGGIILAGGASRRMGRDKAAIRHAGTSFLSRTTKLLETLGTKPIVVLGRPDLPNGLRDRTPLAGPATALIDYLASAPKGSRHLVLPVDMPLLDTTALSRLAEQKSWAYYDGHMLPMLAIADDIPCQLPKRLRDLLYRKKAKQLTVPATERDSFLNLNTPNDLNLWRQSVSQTGVREHG